jgi:hypothetical protein
MISFLTFLVLPTLLYGFLAFFLMKIIQQFTDVKKGRHGLFAQLLVLFRFTNSLDNQTLRIQAKLKTDLSIRNEIMSNNFVLKHSEKEGNNRRGIQKAKDDIYEFFA